MGVYGGSIKHVELQWVPVFVQSFWRGARLLAMIMLEERAELSRGAGEERVGGRRSSSSRRCGEKHALWYKAAAQRAASGSKQESSNRQSARRIRSCEEDEGKRTRGWTMPLVLCSA